MTLYESSSVITPRRAIGTVSGQFDADRTVVWLHGEHDIATSSALSETLSEAIALDESDLLVDLSDVSFMSAATVDVIIRARNFLRPLSRSLMLQDPSARARRVLDLCGLAHFIEHDPALVPLVVETGALGSWVDVPVTDQVIAEPTPPAPDLERVAEPVRIHARTASVLAASEDVADRLGA